MDKKGIKTEENLKNLVMLISIAEELLFSFPVSMEIEKKYKIIRNKVFSDLKLNPESIPVPPKSNLGSPVKNLHKKQHSFQILNIIRLELLSLLQKSQNITESYCNELRFSSYILGNIFNTLSETFEIGQKLELTARDDNEKNKMPETIKEFSENEAEEEIEKYKMKIRVQSQVLKEIKSQINSRAKKIIKIVKNIQEINENKHSDIQGKIQMPSEQKNYRELNELKEKLEEVQKEKVNEERINKSRIMALLEEIKDLHENHKKSMSAVQNHDGNIAEIIKLKEKIVELDLSLHNQQANLSEILSTNKNITEKMMIQEKKLNESLSHIKNLEYQNEVLKKQIESQSKLLENNNETLKSQVIKKDFFNLDQEVFLQYPNSRHEKLKSFQIFNEKDMLNQEILELKAKIHRIENSSRFEIESLKEEIINEKSAREDKISSANTHKRNKSETRKDFEDLIGIIMYIHHLLSPVYANYAHLQKDWNLSEDSQNFLKGLKNEYKDAVIFAEFIVFFLEKAQKDKKWLINKLTEVYEENKSKASSGRTLASPSSLIESFFFKQIWQDMKNNAATLKNFEKSREDLIELFIKSSP